MNFLIFILVSVFSGFVLLNGMSTSTDSSLRLVSLVYRHGDRSPIRTFPTNPVPLSAWPDGPGQLTELGRQQQHTLGSYVRQRYKGFLNSSYLTKEIYVRSTDVDRTIMSAYAHLSGLYSQPKNDLSQDCQLIPVHTVLHDNDNVLNMFPNCPRIDALRQDLQRNKSSSKSSHRFQRLFDTLSNLTGMNITPTAAVYVYDTLNVQEAHKLPLPDWYDSSLKAQLAAYSFSGYQSFFKPLEILRLRVGNFMKELVTNLRKKTNNSITQKMFMYSAHDITLVGFLMGFGYIPPTIPPYASAIFIELHQDKQQQFYVKVLYKDSDDEPRVISVKGCDDDCPLSEFIALLKPLIPVNWEEECSLTANNTRDRRSPEDNQDPSGSSNNYDIKFRLIFGAVGVVIGVVITVIVAVIIVKVRPCQSRPSPSVYGLQDSPSTSMHVI